MLEAGTRMPLLTGKFENGRRWKKLLLRRNLSWVTLGLVAATLLCGGMVASVKAPAYVNATQIERAGSDDVRVQGAASFRPMRHLAVVAGTLHKGACLQGGLVPPAHPQDVLDDVVSALRARGVDATAIGAGGLAVEDDAPEATQLGGAPSSDMWKPSTCDELAESSTYEVFQGGDYENLLYPASPPLARAMASGPYDAVLVVNVNREVSGAAVPQPMMMMTSGTPARASVELSAQLLLRNGSVPWNATVSAEGSLLHVDTFWTVFVKGEPQPELGPVRDAAIARLVSLCTS